MLLKQLLKAYSLFVDQSFILTDSIALEDYIVSNIDATTNKKDKAEWEKQFTVVEKNIEAEKLLIINSIICLSTCRQIIENSKNIFAKIFCKLLLKKFDGKVNLYRTDYIANTSALRNSINSLNK